MGMAVHALRRLADGQWAVVIFRQLGLYVLICLEFTKGASLRLASLPTSMVLGQNSFLTGRENLKS